MPTDYISMYIEKAEKKAPHEKKGEEYLGLQVYLKVFVALPQNSPLLREFEASVGERIDLNDSEQLERLVGRRLRVSIREQDTIYGYHLQASDFRPEDPEVISA